MLGFHRAPSLRSWNDFHSSLPPSSDVEFSGRRQSLCYRALARLYVRNIGTLSRDLGLKSTRVRSQRLGRANARRVPRSVVPIPPRSSSVGRRPLLNNLLGPRGVKSKGLLRKRKTRRRSKTENEWNCGDGAKEVGKNCSRPFKS